MLYVHIAGSSDTLSGTVAHLTRYQCYTVSDVSLFVSPFWRGAQPKDHCSPETQALPRSTRETPARRPRLAAGRTTASLGDRSCWSDSAPSRAPASATRTIRRHPLLQISARASRPSPSTTRGGRASPQRRQEVRRRPGWRRAAPATQPVTRACLNLGHVSRRPRSRPQRRREHRRDVGQLATSRASDERAITWGQCEPAQPIQRQACVATGA
jgi:hypothetical protein